MSTAMPAHRLIVFLLITGLFALVVAGCAGASTPAATAPAAPPTAALPVVEPTTVPPTAEPTLAGADSPLPTPTATLEPTAAPATAVEPSATPAEAPAVGMAQTLAAAFPAAPTAAGEVILVTGQVLDLSGAPVPGAAVEFWQTDANGVYDHPGDAGTNNRDRGFQFYGTSIAGADGRYVFRTVQPGYYEPRPRHIHVKVKIAGRELLTTQFYFEADQASLGNEGIFAQAGDLGDLLILKAIDSVEMADGALVTVLANDLIVDAGSPGALTATPAQAEGPYYPVAPVADYDNDLAAAP